jgi:hypothetical protein
LAVVVVCVDQLQVALEDKVALAEEAEVLGLHHLALQIIMVVMAVTE